ncbi:MAG: response regulator [Lachnospiraceae bacterium]|nr:response regulator [Lachnospiraceae bacterium]
MSIFDFHLNQDINTNDVPLEVKSMFDFSFQTPKEFIDATRGLFKGKRLLLVEDMALNREIVNSLLGDTGAYIDEAENGLEAYAIIRAYPTRYNLVLMDIHMPDMDGFEATRKIRAILPDSFDVLPIIAMTADNKIESIMECLSVGMNDFLGKPIDMNAMLMTLKKYLG